MSFRLIILINSTFFMYHFNDTNNTLSLMPFQYSIRVSNTYLNCNFQPSLCKINSFMVIFNRRNSPNINKIPLRNTEWSPNLWRKQIALDVYKYINEYFMQDTISLVPFQNKHYPIPPNSPQSPKRSIILYLYIRSKKLLV